MINIFLVISAVFGVIGLCLTWLGVGLHRYESAEVALNCGMMLRECLRHEPLARTVLFSEDFFCFFRYVELSTFDIASDAFASFKVHIYSPQFSNHRAKIQAVSSSTVLFFPPSGSAHKTQDHVCGFLGEQLRQGEFPDRFCLFFWSFSHSEPNTLLKCSPGVHRVWKTSAFWQLRHQTAVFEGTHTCTVLFLVICKFDF